MAATVADPALVPQSFTELQVLAETRHAEARGVKPRVDYREWITARRAADPALHSKSAPLPGTEPSEEQLRKVRARADRVKAAHPAGFLDHAVDRFELAMLADVVVDAFHARDRRIDELTERVDAKTTPPTTGKLDALADALARSTGDFVVAYCGPLEARIAKLEGERYE